MKNFAEVSSGFVEIGTITPRAQPGNPKKRMFRIVEHQGIINRMGFNNLGVDVLVDNVRRRKSRGVLGINIGKNADTPIERAAEDYLACMDKVYPHAGYIAINISSPNTPGLRQLQYGAALDELLAALKARQAELTTLHNKYVPIAVKIAPDMNSEELAEVAKSLVNNKIDGVIATNTTLEREMIFDMPNAQQAGGLSGRPLQAKSTAFIRELAGLLQGALPIIGVGGIDSPLAAREKIEAGASLVQIYTGFIYKGPALVRDIVTHLR